VVLLRESDAIVDNGEEGGVCGGYGHSRFFFFKKRWMVCVKIREIGSNPPILLSFSVYMSLREC
jgi:hypothetical protein